MDSVSNLGMTSASIFIYHYSAVILTRLLQFVTVADKGENGEAKDETYLRRFWDGQWV